MALPSCCLLVKFSGCSWHLSDQPLNVPCLHTYTPLLTHSLHGSRTPRHVLCVTKFIFLRHHVCCFTPCSNPSTALLAVLRKPKILCLKSMPIPTWPPYPTVHRCACPPLSSLDWALKCLHPNPPPFLILSSETFSKATFFSQIPARNDFSLPGPGTALSFYLFALELFVSSLCFLLT